jgi:hypothetical protein
MNIIPSLIIGILAGIVTVATAKLHIETWAVFAAWACFFAAGGGLDGLKKGLCGTLSGVAWGVIIVQLLGLMTPQLGADMALFVALTVIVTAMCFAGKLPLLAFIPGAFVGCAVFFGLKFAWQPAAIGLAVGSVMGYISWQCLVLQGKLMEPSAEKAAAQ